MTLDEARTQIRSHLERMNALYGGVVFDEWAVIFVATNQVTLLHYEGGRREQFQKNFAVDAEPLRQAVRGQLHEFGDFEFAHASVGTSFDAGMVLGEGIYLICNNTANVTSGITKDPRWRGAQVAFVELSEKFRSNPVVHPM
jgi:hypothetical protein